MLARQLQGLDPVARLQRAVAVRLEQVIEKLHVEIVILNNQDLLGARAARASVSIHHVERHVSCDPTVAVIGETGHDPGPIFTLSEFKKY
jgi:hypothetical protein